MEDNPAPPISTPPAAEQTTAGDSAWRDELALARESLKARVAQQQAEDGSVEIPHIPQATHMPAQEEQESEQAGVNDAEAGPRRGSTTSLGEGAGEGDEDEEEDAVHEQLTGLRRRRPPADSATEATRDAPAPHQDPAEDLPSCRICFSGDLEDEQELGKLFSPCVCRGTVRFTLSALAAR